jgi:argonaute-like protein implicated in RNA metabolism and viral defense
LGDKKALENIADVLIERQIPKQGINQQELRSMYEDRKRGYFYNIFLGIYAKLGGQPWVLKNGKSGFDRISGLSSRYEDEYLYISLCQYSPRGEFLDGMCRKLPRDISSDEILKELNAYLPKNNILLKTGSLYAIESEVINNITEDSSSKAVEIIDSFPLRIYGIDDSSDKRPELGRCVWLSDQEVALVTTLPYHGTPNPLHIRNVSLRDHEFDEFISLAYGLTQCHIGYRGSRIRNPIPCHASRKALTGFVQLGMNKLDFERPWFI